MGIPDKLVTDNGPSLCSKEMKEFLRKSGVLHIKISPCNPSSNGATENVVRTFKHLFKKCKSNVDVDIDIYVCSCFLIIVQCIVQLKSLQQSYI